VITKLREMLVRFLDWFLDPFRPVSRYWHEVSALMPLIDPAAREQVVRAAMQANLGGRQVEGIRNTLNAPPAAKPGDPRSLSLEQLDEVAKNRAREPSADNFGAQRLDRIVGRVLVLVLVFAAVVIIIGLVTLPFR
jgi:hypothetical protein